MSRFDYNGMIDTYLVKGRLFKLRNTYLGFSLDNREYLREFPAYISKREDYQNEVSNLKVVQSIFPLRCYDPSKSVFAMVHSKENTLLTKNSSVGFHIPYLQPAILSQDPRIMLSIFNRQQSTREPSDFSAEPNVDDAFTSGLLGSENCPDEGITDSSTVKIGTSSSSQVDMTPSALSSNQQTQDMIDEVTPCDDNSAYASINGYDPDSGYLPIMGPYFLSVSGRRRKETEDPYVWVQYNIEKVTGCQHYWAGAFIVCPDCNDVYPCRLCHDDVVTTHTLDRRRVQHMFCLSCQTIGRIGLQCAHCNAIVSRTFCDKCNTLCLMGPEMKPIYHCEYCNVCHVGLKELAQYCDTCKACISKMEYNAHVCDQGSMCPICMVPFSENLMSEIVLPCNPGHKMHRKCFRDMLMNDTITCPLDHKIILDRYRYGILRCENLKRYSETQLSLNQTEPVKIKVYMCHDCRLVSADLAIHLLALPCHFCYSLNCKNLYTLDFTTQELMAEVDDLTSDDLGSLTELNLLTEEKPGLLKKMHVRVQRHILAYRKMYSDIVPTIVYTNSSTLENNMDIIQLILGFTETWNAS